MANAATVGGASVPAPRASRPSAKKSKAAASDSVTPEEAPAVLAAAAVSNSAENAHEQIAKIAYGYWAARGFHGGSQAEDWLRAEQEYYGGAR